MTPWQEEMELKSKIFERYPDLVNVRPLGWTKGSETPSNKLVGVSVIQRIEFDGWKHLPVRDLELRAMARVFLSKDYSCVLGRHNSPDEDAILVLLVLQ